MLGDHNDFLRSSISPHLSNLQNASQQAIDGKLAEKRPQTFLVVEDNKINRHLLVTMLKKLGYSDIHEAFDGREAVRIMKELTRLPVSDGSPKGHPLQSGQVHKPVDVVLMDLWMPEMDGYEATEKILAIFNPASGRADKAPSIAPPTVLAVSADATEKAISRATSVGIEGFMTKPYKLVDLQRLIVEVCNRVGLG